MAAHARSLSPHFSLMKLHSLPTTGLLTITAYDATSVHVNGQRLTRSFILTGERLIEDWPPASIADISETDLLSLADLGCPIILLGTGARQHFPSPAQLRPLYERGIGVEVMDTHAACRTYNILLAEGRAVAAALVLETSA